MVLELVKIVFWLGFITGFTICFGIAVIVIQTIIIKQKENEETIIGIDIGQPGGDYTAICKRKLGATEKRR